MDKAVCIKKYNMYGLPFWKSFFSLNNRVNIKKVAERQMRL